MTLTSVISEARHSRNPWLAATPPATTRVLTGYLSRAFLVLAIKISITAAWKEADRSSLDRLSPFCSALWWRLIKADLSPENENSRLSSLIMARGKS